MEKLQEFLFNNLSQELKYFRSQIDKIQQIDEKINQIITWINTPDAEEPAEAKSGGLESLIMAKMQSDPELAKSPEMAAMLTELLKSKK